MAFFPSPNSEGDCCDDPCVSQEDPCDPCCVCLLEESVTGIYIATYETQVVGPSSTCEKKFFVCTSTQWYDANEDACGYQSGGPEYFAELERWLIGDYENETIGCDTQGEGKYLDDDSDVKYWAYFTTYESVIDGGWVDNTGCDSCVSTIDISCEDETAECGFEGLECCGSGVQPCGSGISPCCGSGTTPCGSGIPPCCGSGTTPCGSGVGSGVGSGCCTDPDPCQGSGCCTDPDPCEPDCEKCYKGEPETKTFCVETVTTICDEDEVEPPTSSCT